MAMFLTHTNTTINSNCQPAIIEPSKFIKKIKPMASFLNLKAKMPTPPLKMSSLEGENKQKLMDDMLKEVDLMPNKYKIQHQNHSFLNKFL